MYDLVTGVKVRDGTRKCRESMQGTVSGVLDPETLETRQPIHNSYGVNVGASGSRVGSHSQGNRREATPGDEPGTVSQTNNCSAKVKANHRPYPLTVLVTREIIGRAKQNLSVNVKVLQ